MATNIVKILLYGTTEVFMKCEASITVEEVLYNLKKFGSGVLQDSDELVLNSKRKLPTGIYFFVPAEAEKCYNSLASRKAPVLDRLRQEALLCTRSIAQRKRKLAELGDSSPNGIFSRPEWHCLPGYGLPSADKRFKSVGGQVLVMGRKTSSNLREKLVALIEGRLVNPKSGYPETRKVLLYGPMGMGKSHEIFMLARDLAEAYVGKKVGGRVVRIVMVADCTLLVADPFVVLQQALVAAFAADDFVCKHTKSLETEDGLKIFCKQRDEDLVFILDQYQALDSESIENMMEKAKVCRARDMMDEVCLMRKEVRITSAGAREFAVQTWSGHSPVQPFPFTDGLDEDELESYLRVFATGCKNEKVQQLVSEQLGRNPGMLSVWHDVWYHSTGNPHPKPLFAEYQDELLERRGCILGGELNVLEPLVQQKQPSGAGGDSPSSLPASELADASLGQGKKSEPDPDALLRIQQGQPSPEGSKGLILSQSLGAAVEGRLVPGATSAHGSDLQTSEGLVDQGKHSEERRSVLDKPPEDQAAPKDSVKGLNPQRVSEAAAAGRHASSPTSSQGGDRPDTLKGSTSGGVVNEKDGRKDLLAWGDFLNSQPLCALRNDLRDALESARSQSLQQAERLRTAFLHMTMTDKPVNIGDCHVYINPRYFHVEETVARPALPLVRTELVRLLDAEGHGRYFYEDGKARFLLDAELSGDKVPDVVGRAAERCVNGAIGFGRGFRKLLGTGVSLPKVVEFDDGEEKAVANGLYHSFYETDEKEQVVFLRPRSPYYRGIDSLLLQFKKKGRHQAVSLHIEKLQVSLQSHRDHASSTAVAMDIRAIEPWCGLIRKDRRNVTAGITYVIPKDRMSEEDQKEVNVEEIPRGAKWGDQTQCAYRVKVVSIGSIDSKLAVLDKWSTVSKTK